MAVDPPALAARRGLSSQGLRAARAAFGIDDAGAGAVAGAQERKSDPLSQAKIHVSVVAIQGGRSRG
jgi:hypothetical protein